MQGGYAAGNINSDPLFVDNPHPGADLTWGTPDDDYGDLRLGNDSPCIDAGRNSSVPAGVVTDLAGNSRFVDITIKPDSGLGVAPIVDMGAYESPQWLAADAGGPYAALDGQGVALGGLGMSDVPGPLQFEWEWSGDGQFDEASGANPLFSAAGFSPGTMLNLTLRVTDSANRSVESSTTIWIAPVIAYVDWQSPGANNGTSWADAFTSLAIALDRSAAGQTIRVADGTYTPTGSIDRSISFNLKNGTQVLGGYAGDGAPDPNARDLIGHPTILSGDIGAPGDASDNVYHVIRAGSLDDTTRLDGFTITGGNSNETPYDSFGGGVFIGYASLTIANCTFGANSTTGVGGGMYIGGSPTISGCTFVGNSANYGGGLGAYSATLNDCTFIENSATGMGGGMYGASWITLNNCTFTRNTAITGGGGLMANRRATVTNCRFNGNTAMAGGGLYDGYGVSPGSTLYNCTFSGNTGGGLYNYAAAPTLINCTFAANAGGGVTGFGFSLTIKNSILWGNSGPGGAQVPASSGVTHSDVQGGYTGASNINADPLFVRNPDPGLDMAWGTADDDYGDLRLQSGSPCLDAGSNAAIPPGVTTDLDGNDRFSDIPGVNDPGVIVDMGAYERVGVYGVTGALFDPDAHAAKLTFSTAMSAASLGDADLVIRAVNPDGSLGGMIGAIGHSYDSGSRTVSFNLPQTTPDGNYRATLLAGSVDDALGTPLPADYTFDFFILAADANRDRVVDLRDLYILSQNWLGTGKTFSQGDFSGDGVVDKTDLSILAGRWQQKLEPPLAAAPPASPTASRRTPARTPTRLFSGLPALLA